MSVLPLLYECALWALCSLVWVCNAIDSSSERVGGAHAAAAATTQPPNGTGDSIARGLGFDPRQCYTAASSSHPRGDRWHDAPTLPGGALATDALSLLKLLIPMLGIVLIYHCWLDATAQTHQQHHQQQPQQQQQQAPPPMGWFRSFLSRGPKIGFGGSHYQHQHHHHPASQLNVVSLAAPHHVHAHVGQCTCAHSHGMAHGQPQLITPSNLASATEPNQPQYAPLSLQLNFNGFNQLSGPLQYYHTFQREELEAKNGTAAAAVAAPTKSTTVAAATKKDSASVPTSPRTPTSPVSSAKATSPSSPTTSSTPTPTSSAAVPFPPPASEFIPLTLTHESTGFQQTYWLWKHLTFGEILLQYVAEKWTQTERKKYESISSSSSSSEEEDAATTGSSASTSASLGLKIQSATPPLMLRYQGTRISSLLTPAAVFPSATTGRTGGGGGGSSSGSSSPPPPPPTLEICIDYFHLFTSHRLASQQTSRDTHDQWKAAAEKRVAIRGSVVGMEAELVTLQKRAKEAATQLSLTENDVKKLQREVERLEKDLAQARKEREALEKEKGASVGKIAAQKAKLEKEHAELKEEHARKSTEFQEARQTYTIQLDQRHALSTELKALMIRYDALEKRVSALKVHKIRHEKQSEKLRKLSALLGPAMHPSATSQGEHHEGDPATNKQQQQPPLHPGIDPQANAAVRMKQRYDLLEQEHNVLNVQLNELRLASHEIDDLSKNEHYKLRYRLKLLEKDARDLAKWKSLARSAEADAREALRWKSQLKQMKVRERQQEREQREAQAWRVRAREVEKEVRDLRMWKQAMEGAGASGSNPTAGGAASASSVAASAAAAAAGGPQDLLQLLPPPVSHSAPPGFEPRLSVAHHPSHQQQQQQQQLGSDFNDMSPSSILRRVRAQSTSHPLGGGNGNGNVSDIEAAFNRDLLRSVGPSSRSTSTSATPPDLEALFASTAGAYRASSFRPSALMSRSNMLASLHNHAGSSQHLMNSGSGSSSLRGFDSGDLGAADADEYDLLEDTSADEEALRFGHRFGQTTSFTHFSGQTNTGVGGGVGGGGASAWSGFGSSQVPLGGGFDSILMPGRTSSLRMHNTSSPVGGGGVGVGSSSSIDVAASADGEPEFTHTLPSFLAH